MISALEQLHAVIKSNILLSPGLSMRADSIEEILDQADSDADFQRYWQQADKSLARKIEGEAAVLANAIDELVYVTMFNQTQNSDFAAYVTEDFELIVKALTFDENNTFLAGLLKHYLAGEFPRGLGGLPDCSIPMAQQISDYTKDRLI
jgi:hypothetical protein